jgi:DNA primase
MEDNSLLLTLIHEVLGRPKKSNKHRGQYAYDCPVCSAEKGMPNGDGKGKFEVNIKRGVYKCWVCHESHGTHGSLKKLLSKFGGPSIWKKAKKLGISFKVDKNKVEPILTGTIELPKGFTRFEDSNPNLMVHKEGWNYLTKQRKLTPETIYKHKMGYTLDEEYANRIIIPSYDDKGELNYFTARSWLPYTKMRYKNPDVPRETIIFNEYLVNWDGTIYIVEGPLDHVVVHNSIPLLGKDIHDKLIQTIMDRATGHVVVLLDGEEKVWNTAKKIYSKINVGKMYDRVKIIKLKEDYDIGKINEDFGRQGVVDVLRSSFKLKESKI